VNPAERRGIDWADEPKSEYAFHWLLGHHGLFSLTPIYFLSMAGVLAWLVIRPPGGGLLAAFTLVLTVGITSFYIYSTNNYGGWTNGPRWLIWLTPFLLLTMLPAADWLGESAWGRSLAYLLLALSVFSASYRPLNPWRHPWIFDLLEALGWIHY
jgi:hypothetical protein